MFSPHRFSPLSFRLLLAGSFPWLGSADAATSQFWNVGGTGGDGIWGTGPAEQNWNTAVGAVTPNISWPVTGDHVANFQDATGGTVTVFGEVTATGIRQNGASYAIDGGTIRLTADGAGVVPFIAVESGALSIASALAGDDGLIKSGTGTLTLSGFNSYTGATQVRTGTLVLAGPDQLSDDGALTLSSGTTLTLNGGPETVASVVSNGGTISGAGVLSAATYLLNNQSVVSGNLGNGTITTRGAVAISGSTGAGSLSVENGALTFTGLAGASAVQVAAAGILAHGGSFIDTVTLTNAGSVAMNVSDTIGSYISNGGILYGSGVLTADSYLLNDGSQVTGNLGTGTLTTSGEVMFHGTSAAAVVNVGAGSLILPHGHHLSDLAAVNVTGSLGVYGPETIGALVVNGGEITGGGTLTAASYLLKDGSEISGHLGAGTLTSLGSVLLSGSSVAGLIQVASGILTNTGRLGTADGQIDLANGARLIADGIENFARLTTSGTGIWQGNLTNPATVAPGDDGAIGTLRVEGDFANAPGGVLSLDAGASGLDLLQVTGNASFAGLLEIHQFGVAPIEAFVPYQVIQAGTYGGNFDALSEDLAGTVFFNPANGSITRLDFEGNTSFLSAATGNQASTWAALYDDVIDPGVNNIIPLPGQTPPYAVTGGIASEEDPDLLWALSASLTPDGLDGALLNRLSPEVYLGLSDYAIQATRHHRRTAWSAPTLATATAVSGSKDAKAVNISPNSAWEFFAAADYFDGETTGSLNQADYQLTGAGVVAGARFVANDRLRIAAYLAGDDGEIRGSLIDATGTGLSAGVSGEWLIAPENSLRVTGGMAFGRYSFDGSRGSAVATAAGWSPGLATFSDVDTEALDLHLGIDAVAWKAERFMVIPSLGLNYTTGSADAFREYGGPSIALAVDDTHRDSLVGELAVAARAIVTQRVTVDGQIGLNVDLREDSESISARFATGSRPMAATGTPLADELMFIGVGATWSIHDDVSVRLGYRAECREDADTLNSLLLSTGFRF